MKTQSEDSVGIAFAVSWGYDVDVELLVNPRTWSLIKRGHLVTRRGTGYHYEGDHYQDIWVFNGGLDGILQVSYRLKGNGSFDVDGFVGTPRDALASGQDEHGFAVTGPEAKLLKIRSDFEASNDPGALELANVSLQKPFAAEVEEIISRWKANNSAASGWAAGYSRAVKAAEIKKWIEIFVQINGKLPCNSNLLAQFGFSNKQPRKVRGLGNK